MKVKNKYRTYCCILAVISLLLVLADFLFFARLFYIYNYLSGVLSCILLLVGYLKFFNSRKNVIFLLSPLLCSLSRLFYAIRYSYGYIYAIYEIVFSVFTGIIFIIVAINCGKAFKFTRAVIVCLIIALSLNIIIGFNKRINLQEFSFILTLLSLIVFHLSKLKNESKYKNLAQVKTRSSQEYLYELKQLRESNQISEAEYQKRKTDILDKM